MTACCQKEDQKPPALHGRLFCPMLGSCAQEPTTTMRRLLTGAPRQTVPRIESERELDSGTSPDWEVSSLPRRPASDLPLTRRTGVSLVSAELRREFVLLVVPTGSGAAVGITRLMLAWLERNGWVVVGSWFSPWSWPGMAVSKTFSVHGRPRRLSCMHLCSAGYDANRGSCTLEPAGTRLTLENVPCCPTIATLRRSTEGNFKPTGS